MNQGTPNVEPTPLPLLTGYRQLSPAEVLLANKVKAIADQVGHLVEVLRRDGTLDQRWVSVGATDLQTGFMALVRAITRPTTF